MLVVLANKEEAKPPMPTPTTPKSLLIPAPSPTIPTELNLQQQFIRNEARLTAVVEAAYILEAIRR
jgi:hypothetical protein